MPRRTFLVRLGVTVAAVGAGAACGGADDAPGEGVESLGAGPIVAGNVSDVPIGHFALVPGRSLVLARDEEGLYALSTICTHQGCDMAKDGTISSAGLACRCHGSRFALSGAVLAGPARRPLPHFKVGLASDGAITVEAGTIVASTTRTPVTG